MRRYDNILLDLDGTITESGPGITKSVQYALKTFGIEVDDLESLRPFVGPPLDDSFKRFYGFTDEQAQEGIRQYRIYYGEHGMLDCNVYDGVREALTALKNAGKKLYLATSKPEYFAVQIMEHFGFTPLFAGIYGPGLHDEGGKAKVIARCLRESGIDPKASIMVGDRNYDIEGARQCGLDAIGVLYGYGTEEELNASHPAAIVKTPKELADILLKEAE